MVLIKFFLIEALYDHGMIVTRLYTCISMKEINFSNVKAA